MKRVLLALAVFCQCNLYAQTVPSFNGLKSSGLPIGNTGIPKSADFQSLSSNLDIPYKDEIRKIRELKQSYDSLRKELKEIRETVKDSTAKDSLLNQAKVRGQEVLDKESEVLVDLINEAEIPGQEIKSAAQKTLNGVHASRDKIAKVEDIEGLESILDQNEENLKALTNEWLMPKVEELVTGVTKENIDPLNAKIPDFYGKGALEKFGKEGIDSKALMTEAKEHAKGKAMHLSDSYLADVGGDFNKLKLDSLGDVTVIKEAKGKKIKVFEENKLKGESLLGRTGAYFWYDPLSPFGKGLFAEAGMSYAFTHQFSIRAGGIYKSSSSKMEGPRKDGRGLVLSMRFTKGNWGLQTTFARENLEIKYPSGYENLNFEGYKNYGAISLVREIPMTKVLRSIVMLSWNPWYQENQSLASSAIQLKIGFEIFRLKGIKKELPSDLKIDSIPVDLVPSIPQK